VRDRVLQSKVGAKFDQLLDSVNAAVGRRDVRRQGLTTPIDTHRDKQTERQTATHTHTNTHTPHTHTHTHTHTHRVLQGKVGAKFDQLLDSVNAAVCRRDVQRCGPHLITDRQREREREREKEKEKERGRHRQTGKDSCEQVGERATACRERKRERERERKREREVQEETERWKKKKKTK
jgi:hypothetical protein